MTGELRALTNLARAASAGSGDVESLVGRMCASIAESFGLERVDAYRYFPDQEHVLLLSGVGVVGTLDDRPLFRTALETCEPQVADGELVLPLLSAAGVVGFLAGPCDRRPPAERLDVLSACAALVALSLQRALEQEELERLGKLKSNFIALASHELRGPATIVHGIATTLDARAGNLDQDEGDELRRLLVTQTQRLTRLIDELLDLSRLEAKAIEIRPQRVPVLDRVHEIVEAAAGERAGEVEIDVDPELATNVDPGALDRILSNLVTNALRYGSRPIRIRAQQQDRHFRLAVEDHGEGVAPGFVPRLFDRFSRADGAPPKIGSGLGLSIAQSYAQAHGGQLFYEDASPKGARFQLVLPAPHD